MDNIFDSMTDTAAREACSQGRWGDYDRMMADQRDRGRQDDVRELYRPGSGW